MIETIGYNLLQVLFVLAFAPLYAGVLARLKEMVQSKRGPSVVQPYRDIWKLFHKDQIVSDQTTWIFRVTPYLVFVMPIFVTILIPVLTDYPLVFAFMGDMLAGGFFLGLAGFFAALAAVDTGKSLRADGSQPDAHGRFPRRAGIHDCVLHGFIRLAIDDSLHRATKMGGERCRFLLTRARPVADRLSYADSGRGRTNPGGQSLGPLRTGDDR